MKKVILEEIENMKYLLGYKRGVVISEQTTVSGNDLDNIPGETPAANTGTPAANTGTPAANTETETPNPTISMGVFNPRVQVLQQLLNNCPEGATLFILICPCKSNGFHHHNFR